VPVQVVGDAPGAISYDVFAACICARISGDGVSNLDAVLIAGPHAQMNYGFSSAPVRSLR
jgi:hypothetical protein